jgi:hypothetical protein
VGATTENEITFAGEIVIVGKATGLPTSEVAPNTWELLRWGPGRALLQKVPSRQHFEKIIGLSIAIKSWALFQSIMPTHLEIGGIDNEETGF